MLQNLGAMTGWSCWDLGAHYGFYSVGLARRAGPTGEVAAFEPNPLSFRRLEYHRRLNRLAWLKVFPAAASDQTGQAEMYTYGELLSTTTHLRYEGETRIAACAPLVVTTIKLDDLVAAGTLRPPDFVKIDVEGHGHRALVGMQATVARHRPHLLCELHTPLELTGMQAILAPLGYEWPATAAVGQDVLVRRPA
ncbi:MAG TPA: FkbM family methyltransferase [Opitutaceae bacterium]|nr:FkbM family methyltransferase [Opitutaceae bacterium]